MSVAIVDAGSALLEAARSLRPTIEACADQIDRERRLPEPLVDALAEAGLLAMLVPRELGGAQVDPDVFLRVVEETSRADGSVGWCLHVGGGMSMAASALAPDSAREIWGHNPRAYVAGSATANGIATVVPGGYRLSGRWGFASGCLHATWLIATVNVFEAGARRIGPNGLPESLYLFLPREDCEIVDTWDVAGMRGTGSHDFIVEDVFVPARMAIPRSSAATPWTDAPLYAMGAGAVAFAGGAVPASAPWTGLSAAGMAAVCLGVARGALDAFATLAALKTPTRRDALLRDDPVVHAMFGRAEAKVRGARSFFYETLVHQWRTVQQTGVGTSDGQAMIRLASVHASETAVEVVQSLWRAAGTSAIANGSPLDRRLGDVMVASQNVSISPMHAAETGRLLLASPPRD